MNIWIYTLILVASFLGLIAGIIISRIAVEEITYISKYLRYLNLAIVPIIIVISTFSLNRIFSLIFSIVVLIALVISRNKYSDAWTYSCMGALMYVSSISDKLLNTAILIFIYGMSIATINSSNTYKNKINNQVKTSESTFLFEKILRRYSYYLIVGISFYVIFSFFL